MSFQLISTTADSEIVSTRVVNFQRELVYAAWTDPVHLKVWWGPAGFTNTFHEFNLRVGGRWRFTMHGPEKGNYENECEFMIIEKPEMLAWNRISKPIFQVLVTFEEAATDKTKIVFKQLFHSPEECAKLQKFVVDKNEENFDRLEEELAKMIS